MMLMTGLCWYWMSVCLSNHHPGPFSSITHSLTFMPIFRNLILHFGYPRSPNLQYIWVYSSIVSPTPFYEMEINAWDFSFFFLLTKDLQKKSQCQIQRLPKLLIHQIILAMRGFWGHEHRTNGPRPEIGQEKCFMCPNQTSTICCCMLLSIQKDQFATINIINIFATTTF